MLPLLFSLSILVTRGHYRPIIFLHAAGCSVIPQSFSIITPRIFSPTSTPQIPTPQKHNLLLPPLSHLIYQMSVTLHTGLGDVKIELYCRQVPLQAANFLALCASGVYTNTIFHRVFPGFMAQAGDPTGTGKTSRAAFAKRLPDEIAPSLTFARAGVVAFANNGRPSRKGVGSQFFITVTAARHLDVTCTIVGKVIWGLAVVKNICAVATDEGRPKDDVRIEAVTIHANPFASGDIELELPASAKGAC